MGVAWYVLFLSLILLGFTGIDLGFNTAFILPTENLEVSYN